MKTGMYLKLQKKFGGKWIASSKTGSVVYGQAGSVNQLFATLKKKGVEPQKTVIGYIEKYGQLSAYLSISTQKYLPDFLALGLNPYQLSQEK